MNSKFAFAFASARRCGALVLVAVPLLAVAQFRGGGGAMMARSSITDANRASQMAMDRSRQTSEARNARVSSAGSSSSSRSVSRETSRTVNRDVNIDVDEGIDIDHPIAAGAMIGATAAAIGSYYASVPAGCPIVHTYSVPYYHCNGVYYEQRMQGDQVVYVVVQP
ncbi:hypothetical protein DWG18_05385 [Lysobacter sp. TY2-98]|uniref:hypothetical protein n=1 Tax=Lysobacter sp. TY2-98 TaxID=2290922 RepID=UPI000E20B5C1|nr:hypothetical protein [Lysobacter sp. TY2-98]AXK71776.1 hypothetical protein DWG18_05385 [Lysobacter sp. TY2-98]